MFRTAALIAMGLGLGTGVAGAQGPCPPQPLELFSPSATYLLAGSPALIDGDRIATNLQKGVLSTPKAVAVFERDPGTESWFEKYTLLPPILGGGLWTGALDGDTLVAWEKDSWGGQQDAVYVYQLNPGVNDWTLMKTVALDTTSVELAGNTLVVDAGLSVDVRERHLGGPNNWGVDATLAAPSPTAWGFGGDLALSGDTLAVADPSDYWPTSFSGCVTVFDRVNGVWTPTQLIYQPNGIGGQAFGVVIALEGDLLLVGATGAKVAGEQDAGVVFVFSRDQGGPDAWGLVTKIKSPEPGEKAYFGGTLSLSGDLAVIGESSYSSATCQKVGRAYLFQRDRGGPDSWGLVTSFDWPDSCVTGAWFGRGALSGSTAVIGTAPSGPEHRLFVYEDLRASCPMAYCTAGTSAQGCQAFLDATGAASATSAAGFTLAASGVEGGKDGLFFFGANGRQANPWGNGASFQCVAPPVSRAGLLPGSGTSGQCDGSFALDLNALWCPSCSKPHQNPGAGAIVQAQLWYRDPLSTSNQTTSLSDAIEFTMAP